jgi:hypothetical protein
MFKATRDFIRDRQPFAKYSVQLVSVRQVGGGEDGKVYQNAHRCIDRERGIKIVSGWLVKPYNPLLKQTEIVQHWWNVDAATRTYFDTSPGVGSECEYVLDMDLAEYGIRNFEDVPANVCQAVQLREGKYTMVDLIFGELFYKPIDSLETAALFKKVI